MHDARFVVIGAGGLGCPALLGLVAAGARTVTIVDPDRVEAGNLHRQVLYDLGDVGTPKAEAAATRLRARGITARAIVDRIAPGELASWLDQLDGAAIVLECSDQVALKFAVNDALVAGARRGVIASALGWRGHAMALAPGSACYRCVFEAPPPPELVPTCAQAGVLGPAVGAVGWLQAQLAASLVAAAPGDHVGRLFELDALGAGARSLGGRRRHDCSTCGSSAIHRAHVR